MDPKDSVLVHKSPQMYEYVIHNKIHMNRNSSVKPPNHSTNFKIPSKLFRKHCPIGWIPGYSTKEGMLCVDIYCDVYDYRWGLEWRLDLLTTSTHDL
jgi:hypothetical protein